MTTGEIAAAEVVVDDDNEEQAENDSHIWLQILSQVHESRRKTASGKQIIVLGDKRCGKSGLIAKMRNLDESKAQVRLSSGLEYAYLDVRDDVREEDSTRTHVWIVDGDAQHVGLLRHAVTSVEALSNTLLLVCIPICQPTALLEYAQTWLNAFEASVVSRVKQSDEVAFAELQRSLEKNWKEAACSFDKVTTDVQEGSLQVSTEESQEKLEEGVLLKNLGLPVVFCVTKCDTIAQVEKEFELNDELFDFIQVHLRRLAMKCKYTVSS